MAPSLSMNALPHEEFLRALTRHHRRVLAYIGTLLPNRDDAEEVMQETSLVLWRKWEQFDPAGDFFPWACGIAHYEVLRYRRATKAGKLQFNDALIEQIAAEQRAQADIHDQRHEALLQCLKQLNAQEEELVRQRYRERANIQQLAEQTGRQANTLYKMLERIRKRLLECVDRRLAGEERRS